LEKTEQDLRDELDAFFYAFDAIRREEPAASFERYEAARKMFEAARKIYNDFKKKK
jgi:hypothetical protein